MVPVLETKIYNRIENMKDFKYPIENDFKHIPLNDNDIHDRLIDLNLFCGYNVQYHQLLEGGGIDHRRDFLRIINIVGNTNYNYGLEWCSGPGVIGFELLGAGIVNKVGFIDLHKPAIDSIHLNAERNGLLDKITTFNTDKIREINTEEKFDLVIGNPPHAFDYNDYVKEQMSIGNDWTDVEDHPYWDNQVRIDVDLGMGAHREFFDSIKGKITDDCDIFISEMGPYDNVTEFAKQNGFYVVADWTMTSALKGGGKLLHFKLK